MGDGYASHYLDLVIVKIETTAVQQHLATVGLDALDRLRHSGGGKAEQRQSRCRGARVAGKGKVDVRFLGPHGEALDQGG